MKIEKAVELLKDIGPDRATLSADDLDAIKLGIEALKRIKSFRTNMGSQRFWQLPGETQE